MSFGNIFFGEVEQLPHAFQKDSKKKHSKNQNVNSELRVNYWEKLESGPKPTVPRWYACE